MIRRFGNKIPKIHPTAFVSEAAYVVGDVEVGEGSSIWPGAVLRGNEHKIKIGRFVNIQDNSVIHSDADCSYGDHITIGHNVICHATTVEEHCLIGNGAIVNGHTIIRHHSVISSGSVVMERVEIPPFSFATGSPAEVRRQITERHLQMVERYTSDYQRYAQEFKRAGLEDPDREQFNDPNV